MLLTISLVFAGREFFDVFLFYCIIHYKTCLVANENMKNKLIQARIQGCLNQGLSQCFELFSLTDANKIH